MKYLITKIENMSGFSEEKFFVVELNDKVRNSIANWQALLTIMSEPFYYVHAPLEGLFTKLYVTEFIGNLDYCIVDTEEDLYDKYFNDFESLRVEHVSYSLNSFHVVAEDEDCETPEIDYEYVLNH